MAHDRLKRILRDYEVGALTEGGAIVEILVAAGEGNAEAVLAELPPDLRAIIVRDVTDADRAHGRIIESQCGTGPLAEYQADLRRREELMRRGIAALKRIVSKASAAPQFPVAEPEFVDEAPIPPEFAQVVAELRRRGFYAACRSWAMGETVFVGAGEHWDRGIHYFERAAYLHPVGPNSWGVDLSNADDDAPSSLSDAVERAATFLASTETYRAESLRRWRRSKGQF